MPWMEAQRRNPRMGYGFGGGALAGYAGLSYLFAGSCPVSAIIFRRLPEVDDRGTELPSGSAADAAV